MSADNGDADQAVAVNAAVEQVAGDSVATNATSTGDLAVTATNDNSTVSIPTDPADGITVASNGVEIGIGLPGATKADDATVLSAGTAVYTDAAVDTSIAAQALADGSLRALITIEGPNAPTQYRFPIDLPADYRLETQDDGTINIIDASGVPVSHFDAPWATDVTGAAVPTTLTVDGNTIVQTVNHTGNYPIVADPHYTWGFVTGTVYFNKNETNKLMLGYGVSALVGGYFTGGLAAIPLGSISLYAAYVLNAGHCMKMKVVPTPLGLQGIPGEYWGTSGGGYCK
ncbi:hypothetical protein [Ilumatobacter sp.]|uniref:hypothetical protein n=1 Tax=Ilumatobacter sp. TaxID=1967498 RepID=UPI0037504B2A